MYSEQGLQSFPDHDRLHGGEGDDVLDAGQGSHGPEYCRSHLPVLAVGGRARSV